MAHHVEPMDIDSDFDNKENSLHHNNVLPFTEKGYEELDVSELNMKLRYSVTPGSSPMSKSFTANCTDNRSLESGDDSLNVTVNENFNLTHSLNSTLTKNDNVMKSLKGLPLQSISTEQFVDNNRNTSVLRSIDTVSTPNNGNITVTVSGPSDADENLSLPSSSSSAVHTPEATTPTKDIPHKDGGSPIMRGLKSVLNMFRSSQSPIPADNEVKQDILSPVEAPSSQESKSQTVSASTPIASRRKKEMSPTKRSSPQKDSSIVFNDDLEKELQWKDETTIIFSQERIPIHKLMLQQPQDNKNNDVVVRQDAQEVNTTVEYMDISYNDSFKDRTITEVNVDIAKADATFGGESDSEFVDCETTFTKNKSPPIEDNNKTSAADQTPDLDLTKEIQNNNDSGSRLKQIILDTTQDILDATLSIRPEDLLTETLDQTKDVTELVLKKTESIDTSTETNLAKKTQEESSVLSAMQPVLNQTVDISNPLVVEVKNYNPSDLNSTNIIQVTSQQVNQTFDMTNTSGTHEMDVTKTLENILGVTQVLEKNELTDPNSTKTIDVNTSSQAVNQTFNIPDTPTNENDRKENLNVTKTLENVLGVTQVLETDHNTTKTVEAASIYQNINVVFNNTHALIDETHKKEYLDSTKVMEDVIGVAQIVENNIREELNCTKSIELAITATAINQTSEVAHAVTNENQHKENMDITKTLNNVLDETQVLNDKPKLASEKLNADTEAIEVINNSNNTIDKFTPGAEETCMLSAKIPEMPTIDETPHEEVIEPLPIPDDVNSSAVQDVTMTGLPVDIPLPDEDDLENMNIDTVLEVTPPVSLPLDLVDVIKTTTKIDETLNSTTDGNEINLTKNLKEVIIAKAYPINTYGSQEDDDKVSNEIVEDFSAETIQINSNVAEEINIENEMSDLCQEILNTNLMSEVVPTLSIINTDEEKLLDGKMQISKNNTINIETNVSETVTAEKAIQQLSEDVIQNETVSKMDNDETGNKFQPLPDIVNQTIASSNIENLETIPLDTPISQRLARNSESSLTDETNIPEINAIKIEQQIANPLEEQHIIPSIETEKVNDEMLPAATADGDKVAQKLSNAATSKGANLESQTDDSIEKVENVILSNIEEVQHQVIVKSNVNEVEEEIVLSENNSPFVSVIADDIPESQPSSAIENGNDPFASKTKVVLTPPTSPPIRSKGYNFNFDDIDFDPFATKTNIRMSPTLDSPNKHVDPKVDDKIFIKPAPKKDNNRRKSQPERKKPVTASKRKFNATFDGKINDKITEKTNIKPETSLDKDIQIDPPSITALSPNNVTIEEKDDQKTDLLPQLVNEIVATKDKIEKPIETSTEASDNSIESNFNELKPTLSSSDQSTYFSACTTSSESSIPSRNVFNLPEIDDINFNPFATKSKMRQSPPPDLNIDNPFATRSKVMSSPDASLIVTQKSVTDVCDDKIETELMEKDASVNLSNSSKVTDENNVTTKEIHTEDEDTVEGPFLDSEDLNPDVKMSDFEGENIDMLQFNELPRQNNEGNLDNGEMFIDAEAFEFLLNQNKCNTVADSGKESLFLKFDPLFAKRMSAVSSDGVLASLTKLQKRQSTPTKTAQTPPKNISSPVAGPSNLNVTQDMDMNVSEELNDELNITVSKPMMVVPPAVNSVTPRNKSITPNRSNRRSFTFTSPAMAVIDRLLSLSSNNSPVHDTTVNLVSREQNEADIALSQLRELLAEKEINVYNLKCESNELRDRLNTLEGHVKSLEAESEDRLKKINQLNDALIEKTKINKSMAAVVEEYERTIASLIAETAQDKKRHAEERLKLISERDEQTAHLASMEVSFSDLHSKYEKSKQIILNCKANEDVYKKSIKEFEENLTKMHKNYELLKQHATSKLNHANQELEKINRSHEAEVLKLNAMIKRKELHITSLEESLAQKTKANDELTAICDELINKVG